MRLATVLETLGDLGSANLELTAARTTFERHGAEPETREAARRLGDDQPTVEARAFMFTDIVNSTALLTTVGDAAWHGIRQWHDRTVATIVGDRRYVVHRTTVIHHLDQAGVARRRVVRKMTDESVARAAAR